MATVVSADPVKGALEDPYIIKPEADAPKPQFSDWPLLLKNYDKRMYFMKLELNQLS